MFRQYARTRGLFEIVGVAKKFGLAERSAEKRIVTGKPSFVSPAGTMMSGKPVSSAKSDADSPPTTGPVGAAAGGVGGVRRPAGRFAEG